MRTVSVILFSIGFLCGGWLPIAAAQGAEHHSCVSDLFLRYDVDPNITYAVENNTELKLDVYHRRGSNRPGPAVMFIHGGGWIWENKEQHVLVILPYLDMGCTVINVEYRLAQNAPAPAAVEDCRSAFRWIVRNADKYQIDKNRIVVIGRSAGGHLALMTGLLPASAGFDTGAALSSPVVWTGVDKSDPRPAAIVNWYGITDVADLLSGPNARDYAIAWLAHLPNREKLAHEVSPLTYVRPGVPPVLTIHADNDPVVPYSHAVRLHEALQKAGVPNQLWTIHGGYHGAFSREQYMQAFRVIHQFLERHGIFKHTLV